MICTRFLSVSIAATLLTLVAAIPSQGGIYFADTFDRSTGQLDDIDATTIGITAAYTLPADVYTERDAFLAGPDGGGPITQAEADALTNVENDQLHLADGPNASIFHINHNFVGAGIVGLKTSLDLVSNDGGADELARWVGIGFGATQAEAESAVYSFGNNSTSPAAWKGNQNGTSTDTGFADFYVAWERTGNANPNNDNQGRIAIWKNGERTAVLDNAGNFFDIGSTLEIDMSFADFNAGTNVSVDISYDGSLVASDSFAWDNTDANYIGIEARQDGAGWTVDNLVIESSVIPEPQSLALMGLLAAGGIAFSRRKRS